jgi:pimeloyl-ACP methyl ester carboxylesterase
VTASFFNVVTHPDMRSHRAILIDYLGSGFSDHPLDFDYSMDSHALCIAAVLDKVDCCNAAVVGHSMGERLSSNLLYQDLIWSVN